MKKIFCLIFMFVMSVGIFGCSKTIENVDIGDVIVYGKYDEKPLQWIVLDVKDTKKLFLLKNSFGRYEYDDTESDFSGMAKWENCTLRKILNEKFYVNAFSEQEKMTIISTERRDNVFDKIFVLNEREICNYLEKEEKRKCSAINFASEYETWVDSDNGFTFYLLDNVSEKFVRYVNSDGEIRDGSRNQTYAVRPAMWVKVK